MIEKREGGFERRIEFSAAFDRRDPNPSKNYGIHGVDMRWILLGNKGAVQFLLFTDWQLRSVRDEYERSGRGGFKPIPADLGYHSPTPRYEHQEAMDCDLIPGGRCFYDGSGLNAEPVFDLLCEKGEDAVWAHLEDFYRELFEKETP